MIPNAISRLIALARNREAADIHICANSPILARIGKELLPLVEGVVTPDVSRRLVLELLEGEQVRELERRHDLDMMIADKTGRYRLNVSYNDGAVGAVIRILPAKVRTIDELRLPAVCKHLAWLSKGLVLITGSTSQGKTSTLSGIIEEINRLARKHVITIEDPIENMYENRLSLVRQREVGRDTDSFATGLRAALRQDPDVIAVGEMRDYETIRIALTAAETGVLVLSTLHSISIDKMMERLVSYAPPEEHIHFRYLFAGALQAVVHQELLPAKDGKRRVACEVLLANDGVRNLIRHRDGFLLRNIIQTGARAGMVTMRQSVDELLAEGAITQDVAENVLANY